MLVILVAMFLRFWQLGDLPTGLYRDEAANGLDALDVLEGSREGQSPFYFEANNGREPLYIYLTSLFVALMGQSAEAVRIGAAVAGTLTTVFIYLLAKEWFGKRVGILTATVWAVTVWPIHLSRIGLRPILLPMFITISFWLGTLAYRKQQEGRTSVWLWFLSGAFYGVTFYTYLAARFTPLLLITILVYLILTKRHKLLWPGVLLFVAGALIILIPFILLFIQEPNLVAGRLDQVSILNPDINDGSLAGALFQNILLGMGMFLVKGDTILRHNPSGRAVFDLFMLIPFLIGLVWCIRNWRKPASAILLLWIAVMLGPTIFADDAPHFLRAVGVLPAAVMLPALGLSQLWSWSKLPSLLGKAVVVGLLLASLGLTIKDYFVDYGPDEITGYWFEAAARSLAEEANIGAQDGDIMMDRRYQEGWPSISFLIEDPDSIAVYRPGEIEPESVGKGAIIYAWPHEALDQVASAIAEPALISVEVGDFAKGDLEPEPYPIVVRYTVDENIAWPILASFDNTLQLRFAELKEIGEDRLQVDLYWSTSKPIQESITSFVHLMDGDEIVAQSDGIPGSGYWPSQWWRPGVTLLDRHILLLDGDFNKEIQQLRIGLYDTNSLEPLNIQGSDGSPIGETWLLQ